MAITWQTPSALAYSASGGTSVTVAYPASNAEGEKLILIIGMKPSTANSGSVTTPSNWTLVTSIVGAGGYGTTLGMDEGNTNLFVYERTVPAGGLSGSLVVTVADNNVCWGFMGRMTLTANHQWVGIAGATGSRDTGGGSVSITFTSNPNVTANDLIIGAFCIPTDVSTPSQFSAQAFSQTSVVFGSASEINEPDSNTGNDIGGMTCRALVSSGAGTANPVMTATAGGTTTNVRGAAAFIRVREAPIPATRYWVGGTGTWDASTTTNWALTSGGAGGASVPTASTNVVFDNNSDSGAGFTVTHTGTVTCLNHTIAGLDQTMTVAGSGTVQIAGNVAWQTTNIVASGFSGVWYFNGGGGVTQNLNFGGITNDGGLRFQATATTVFDFASNYTSAGGSAVTLYTGTLNTNGYNFYISSWRTVSGTFTLNLGASTLTITGLNGFEYAAGNTLNAGTSTIDVAGGTSKVQAVGYTLNNLNFSGSNTGTITLGVIGNLSCNNFTSTQAGSGRKRFLLSGGTGASNFITLTVNSTLTVNGTNHKNATIFENGSILYNQASTISAATVNLNYANFFGIAGTGAAAPFTGTSLGNVGWNSGITFTAAKTVYVKGSGATSWTGDTNVFALTSGGTGADANYPLPQDTVIIDNNTTASSLTGGGSNRLQQFGTLDASSRTSAFTLTRTDNMEAGGGTGAIKLSSAITWTSTSNSLLIYSACDVDVVNTLASPIEVRAITTSGGATVKLLRNLTHSTAYGITINGGYLDLNGFTLTAYGLSTGIANIGTQRPRGMVLTGGTCNLNYSASVARTLDATNNDGFEFPAGNLICGGGTGTETMALYGGSFVGAAYAPNLTLQGSFAAYNLLNTYFGNLNASGGSGTLNLFAKSMYGNLALGTNTASLTAATTLSLIGSASTTLATANQNIRHAVEINKTGGGGVTLNSNCTISDGYNFTLTQGNLSVSSYTLQANRFATSNSNTRVINFDTGTIAVSENGTAWDAATVTNLTINGQSTGKIKLLNTAATNFASGGASYPTLELGAAGAVTVSGTNTFHNLTNAVQPADLRLPAGVTTTLANFGLTGTAGNLVTLRSSSAGSAATVSKASGTVSADYLSLQDSTATGGATWYAGANSNNVSNNTGWLFSSPATNADLTESAAAIDAIVNYVTFAGMVTESASVSDLADAVITVLSALNESAAAADSSTVQGNVNAVDITESGSSTDSASAEAANNAAVSESSAASDSVLANFIINHTVSESSAASDSALATFIVHRALSESAAASDAPTASASTLVVLSESASAAESVVQALAASRALTESAAASDTVVADFLAIALQSESAAAADSSTRTIITAATLTESATGADSLLKFADRVAALSESSAATDSVATIVSLGAALTESAVSADSLLGIGGNTVDVVESAAASHTQTALFNVFQALLESASASDAPTATASTAHSVSESAAASESLAVLANVFKSLSENAAASDALGAQSAAVASLSESASAAESALGQGVTGAVLIESVTASTSESGLWTTLAVLLESASATDALQVNINVQSAVLESALAGESNSATAQWLASLAEQAVAGEAATGAITTAGSVIEVMVVGDTIVAAIAPRSTGTFLIFFTGAGLAPIVH